MYRVLICAAAALFIGSQAVAQEKQQVSFKVPGENVKFTVSQNVDIGDVPNHFVRLFETHGVVPENALSINGLKIVEIISRGVGGRGSKRGKGSHGEVGPVRWCRW